MRRIVIAVPVVLVFLVPTGAQASPVVVHEHGDAEASVGLGIRHLAVFSLRHVNDTTVLDAPRFNLNYHHIYDVDGLLFDQNLMWEGRFTARIGHYHQRGLEAARMVLTVALGTCIEAVPAIESAPPCTRGPTEIRVRWSDPRRATYSTTRDTTKTLWRRTQVVATLTDASAEALPGADHMVGTGILYRTRVSA